MCCSPVRQQSSWASFVAAASIGAVLVSACADPGEVEVGGPEFTDNAVAVAWNQVAFDAAFANDGFEDFAVNLRGITMMHLAMHDALNAILPVFGEYAFFGEQPLAHPTAAAAQAARDVLVNIYPAQTDTFDAQLATWLGQVPDGMDKTRGIQLGKDAASAIIAARANDGMDAFGSYSPDPTPEPGDYQFVPPFDFVFRPAFSNAQPFGLTSGTQFRAGPSPSLGSSGYATDYNEVKAFGVLSGSTRSADQTHLALWWYEFAEIGWNRIVNLLVTERGLDLYPAARAFALVNVGLSDAYVAVWNAKRHYDQWRPFTAIRAGDIDGNNATDPDPSWEPLCVTPPTWEYPSAHAMQSAAAAEMLVAALGTDDVSFTATSTTARPGQSTTRSFTTLRGAAAEAAESRVMCGIHFRFAIDAGLDEGKALADSILVRHLRPNASK